MRTARQRLTIPFRLAASLSLLLAFAWTPASANAATPGGVLLQFGTPGSGNGQFSSPSGVAVAEGNNIYVADSGNNRIEKFVPIEYGSQFGTAGAGEGQVNGPSGVAVDSSENVYVADTGNDRIEKFTSEGVYISKFGTAGAGEGQFNGPSGIAYSEGNIYVADTGNDRIEKFTSEGVYVSQFGTAGAGEGQFNGPSGVAVDSAGNVYVADTGNGRVQKFSSGGTFISVLDTSGSQAVAVDSTKNVYVLDRPSGSPSQIDVYNGAGALTYTIEAGDIASSRGLAIIGGNKAVVSDATNDDVVLFRETEPLPQAVTEGAFGALATTATLGGELELSQESTTDTTYRFEYGPTAAYGQSAPIPEGDIGSATTNHKRVLTALTGLNASSTYHYRLVATNIGAGGSGYGVDRTFTTVVLAPAVDTGPPTVAATVATLTGGVLAQGLDTTYHFEYGSTTSYGASAPVPDADAGSATNPESVTQGITGLTPNSTYHYRLVATSIGGTTYGADQAFTTYATGGSIGSVSPFGTGAAPPAPALPYPDVSGLQPTPAPKVATPPPKPLTRAQKLSKVLKACRKDVRHAKRKKCEKEARKKYGTNRPKPTTHKSSRPNRRGHR
jgi:sugar lactone lactonase YvrE